MKTALIIVDMQYDCCDGGPMAHNNSLNIIPIINRIRDRYDIVIFIKKQYQFNHSSFKQFGGKNPKHCIENTYGAELHKDMIIKEEDIIICRGTLQKYDSNSAFYDADTIENDTRLKYILRINNIRELYFCGNGIDNCIFSSIIDAVNNRFKCTLITDALGYIDKEKAEKSLKYLEGLGIVICDSTVFSKGDD